MDAGNLTNGTAESLLAATQWPREYRYGAARQSLIYVFAALVGGVGVWLLTGPALKSAVLLLVSLVMVVLAALIASSCGKARLVLRANAIETRGLLGTRELRLDAIAGRRLRPTRGQSIRLIVPKQGRALELDSGFPADAVLDAWYGALPDLDLKDRQSSEAAVAADPTFGRSAAERLERLASARRLARAATGITVVLLLWIYVFPRPYNAAIVVAAALPWCAVLIARWSQGLICFDSTRNDVRPNLAIMLFAPAVVLGMRALLDVNLLDVPRALEFGFLAGLPLVLAASWVRESNASRAWGAWTMPALLLAFLALPYGAGAVVLADVQLDHQPAQTFHTQVLRKYISSGKHRTSYVVLAPWGPKAQTEKLAVSSAYYAHVEPEATVCMGLHRGALGLAWYRVGDCPTAAGGNADRP